VALDLDFVSNDIPSVDADSSVTTVDDVECVLDVGEPCRFIDVMAAIALLMLLSVSA